MHKLLCHDYLQYGAPDPCQGGMEKNAYSCNPGFVLLASSCCIVTETKMRTEYAEGVT